MIPRIRTSSKLLCALLVLASAWPAVARAEPTSADELRSERYVVYVGVLPAALTRGTLSAHPAPSDSHGRAAGAPVETHHVVVAVFDAASGTRVDDATVEARHVPASGIATTKPLDTMRLGDTVSYGALFVVPEGRDHRFELTIRRSNQVDRVTFVYDNIHGSP